ncbi:MAG: Crp/Fnr family transcriptional regulator [Candidatus Helarchaeota archaeon]|nr:Crp/Fnr family transcriptional regulator [Candidatus Helarchaeota archaeon]
MEEEEATQKMTSSYKGDSVIFFEGDMGNEMYIIKSGEVEIIREMGDGEIVLAKLGENEFFGEMALFGDPKRSATVRAVADSELLVVNKNMLETQFKKVPDWLVTMIKTIAQRILTTTRGLKINFPVNIEYSILKSLILLLSEYGTHEKKGISVNLALVRQEICNIVGISTDEVDDWLKKFDFANLIEVIGSQNRIVIVDEERLQKFLSYLLLISPKRESAEEIIDKNTMISFDRLHKLIALKT